MGLQSQVVDIVLIVVLTAVLSSGLTGFVLWLLWLKVLLPQTEQRARDLAAELTDNASAEVTRAGEALVPQFRRAIRDGITDALDPTQRLPQTAKDVTAAGMNAFEAGMRRLFGDRPGPR